MFFDETVKECKEFAIRYGHIFTVVVVLKNMILGRIFFSATKPQHSLALLLLGI